MSGQRVSIDLISDVVCPWCYIGQKRLELAAAAVPDIAIDLRWRPYQLDPSIPAEGLERKAYMVGKFGSEQRIADAHARIMPLGSAVGIDFHFDDIRVAPNTLDAHRVIRWAANGPEGTQNALVKRLFQLYFEEGRNLGDHAVLVAAAGDVGMDASVVEALLATDSDRDAVEAEVATASRMGVTGVPCYLFEGRYAVVGAQDPDVLADAIRQISEAKARGELDKAN